MGSVVKVAARQGQASSLEKFTVQPIEVRADPKTEKEEALSLIEQARRKAEALLAEAEQAAQQIKQDAWNEGFAEGRKAAEAEYANIIREAENRIAEFETEKEEYWKNIEPELVKLAIEIAAKIIHSEVKANSETVVGVAKAAIRQVRQRESIRVRVNPADLETTKSQKNELLESADGIQHLEIVDDRRVDQGSVILETEDGILDARIRTQLSETEKALMEAANESIGRTD